MERVENVIHQLEIAVLRHHVVSSDSEEYMLNDGRLCQNLMISLQNGNYLEILKHSITKEILLQQSLEEIPSVESLVLNVDKFINSSDQDCSGCHFSRQLFTLGVAVACLQLFVQNNWVGPVTDLTSDPQLKQYFEKYGDIVQSYLSVDGEAVDETATNIVCLFLAKVLLHECHPYLKDCLSADWWLLRANRIHQDLLHERSATLKASALELIENFSKVEQLMVSDSYRDLAMQFHVEAGHICYFYYEPRQAKGHFGTAEKLSGLTIGLTGQLGKRTRFQEKNISQLLLDVEKDEDSVDLWSPAEVPQKSSLPKNVALDDEAVLEVIQLVDGSGHSVENISGAQQALILGLCYRHRKSMEGQGKIVEEECMAYITNVLQRPMNWAVQTTALLMRSQWEWDSARRMQRSMSQLEEIVRQFKLAEPGPDTRLPLVYGVKLIPVWEVKKQLGALFVKIGAINAALEVYLGIESWSEVIQCYSSLGKKEKAEQLIRKQIAVKETPLLWCYLGDLHNEEAHYQKAWELSNGRFGRAQKSLAYLYLYRKEYEKSLGFFEKSLQVNPLQIGPWFSYGCAALACEKFDLAATAFRRCVNLDNDNFEAWNNLATAYIRSKQKSRAFNALQEALKCDFENWRVWGNYLLVAVDLGEFEETIRAYHRLLDIKDKYTDVEVLEILVKAFKAGLKDAQDQPVIRLKTKALELFGRITSKITTDADIWRLYAELVFATEGTETSQTDRDKALQYLQKAHRCRIQVANWEKDVEKCKEVLTQSFHLAQVYIDNSSKVGDSSQSSQMLASARLMVKGVLNKVKQQQLNQLSGEMNEDITPLYTELEKVFSTITEIIQSSI